MSHSLFLIVHIWNSLVYFIEYVLKSFGNKLNEQFSHVTQVWDKMEKISRMKFLKFRNLKHCL